MGEGPFEWTQLFLNLISPILLAILAAYLNKREKDRENARADRQQAAHAETEAVKNELIGKLGSIENDLMNNIKEIKGDVVNIQSNISDMRHDVDGIQGDVDNIGTTIKEMQRYDQDVHGDLKLLSTYHERTSKNVNQLGNLVITLAEGMRDQHLDGNITSAVAAYRSFEHEQYTQFVSDPPIKAKGSD